MECPEHGVRQTRLPWAEPMPRFTILFERLAVDVLKECDVLGAARLLRTSWTRPGISSTAPSLGVWRSKSQAPGGIGVDEKSAGRGQDYITVVADLDRATVEYIADERRQASLDGYFDQLSPEQLAGIEAVAMDMWEPYATSTRAHLDDADAKIVFDRFHVMGYLGKAVDTVRKQENRALAAQGDKSLAGSKYLWLYSVENLPERHRGRFSTLPRYGPQDRSGLGHQRVDPPLLGVPPQRMGAASLEELVLLGDPLPPRAGHRGSPHAQAPRDRAALLLRPSGDQRRRRGTQRPYPGDQSIRPRLPQPPALQDRHLLPLRWTGPSPTNPLNSRKRPLALGQNHIVVFEFSTGAFLGVVAELPGLHGQAIVVVT